MLNSKSLKMHPNPNSVKQCNVENSLLNGVYSPMYLVDKLYYSN